MSHLALAFHASYFKSSSDFCKANYLLGRPCTLHSVDIAYFMDAQKPHHDTMQLAKQTCYYVLCKVLIGAIQFISFLVMYVGRPGTGT